MRFGRVSRLAGTAGAWLWILFLLVAFSNIAIKAYKTVLKKYRKQIHYREYPLSIIKICNSKSHKISLRYEARKAKTCEINSEKNSVEKNKARMTVLKTAVISELCEGEICLLDRSGTMQGMINHKKVHTSENSFCLDTVLDDGKELNDEWLSAQATVENCLGQTIAVRGIDEETLKLGCDIYIPRSSSEELNGMTLSELLKFLNPENCKMQILDTGNTFVFPRKSKETEEKIKEVIRRAADRQGYKVKER